MPTIHALRDKLISFISLAIFPLIILNHYEVFVHRGLLISWKHIWLFDDAVKLKSPYLTQSVVSILPTLTPYLQIGPVTIIAITEYSVQERPICCIDRIT